MMITLPCLPTLRIAFSPLASCSFFEVLDCVLVGDDRLFEHLDSFIMQAETLSDPRSSERHMTPVGLDAEAPGRTRLSIGSLQISWDESLHCIPVGFNHWGSSGYIPPKYPPRGAEFADQAAN
jgi:hypothetical protein